MLLLGLDLETTGLDFTSDRIIEVGAVLWDTDLQLPVQMMNALVWDETAPPLPDDIQQLTGLSSAVLRQHGEVPSIVVARLSNLASHAGAIVAHNANRFDRRMLDAQFQRLDLTPLPLLWIDTCVDVPFPPSIVTRKLVHLAAEHGFLNPFSHRAVFDVLTMLRILSPYVSTPETLADVVASALQPTVTLQALVPWEHGENAQARGYRWRPERQRWLLTLKADRVEKEQSECGFPTAILG